MNISTVPGSLEDSDVRTATGTADSPDLVKRGWLVLHESGTFVRCTQGGADLFV